MGKSLYRQLDEVISTKAAFGSFGDKPDLVPSYIYPPQIRTAISNCVLRHLDEKYQRFMESIQDLTIIPGSSVAEPAHLMFYIRAKSTVVRRHALTALFLKLDHLTDSLNDNSFSEKIILNYLHDLEETNRRISNINEKSASTEDALITKFYSQLIRFKNQDANDFAEKIYSIIFADNAKPSFDLVRAEIRRFFETKNIRGQANKPRSEHHSSVMTTTRPPQQQTRSSKPVQQFKRDNRDKGHDLKVVSTNFFVPTRTQKFCALCGVFGHFTDECNNAGHDLNIPIYRWKQDKYAGKTIFHCHGREGVAGCNVYHGALGFCRNEPNYQQLLKRQLQLKPRTVVPQAGAKRPHQGTANTLSEQGNQVRSTGPVNRDDDEPDTFLLLAAKIAEVNGNEPPFKKPRCDSVTAKEFNKQGMPSPILDAEVRTRTDLSPMSCSAVSQISKPVQEIYKPAQTISESTDLAENRPPPVSVKKDAVNVSKKIS